MIFESVLVANRGEIAVRVIRACREMGIRAIAIHSDVDAHALHVRLADESWEIGPAAPSSSYLDPERVLQAALDSGASAIHPGYGFLSENAAFASLVESAGLVFVGPPASVIERMGDKTSARADARSVGLPVLPGTSGSIPLEVAREVALELGFPLAVKASFGGGGRGLRIAHELEDIDAAVAACAREAAAAFGRPELYFERYFPRARHVEVQVLADAHGTVLSLGTRDCSVQRRHQKLVEEAPAPRLAPGVDAALCDAATRLATAVGYRGAGTVEFLLAEGGEDFYFLEINTRLQVEHGVTEIVTGVDLVQAQLSVAAGEPLGITQADVTLNGHAIEARITAEDPSRNFLPQSGTVGDVRLPGGPWIRLDFGIAGADVVPAEYDSLLGKVLAWGDDREQARRRLRAALGELAIEGISTSGDYLASVLSEAAFIEASHTTESLETDWAPEANRDPWPTSRASSPPGRPDGAAELRRVRIVTENGPVDLTIYAARGEAPEGAQQGRDAASPEGAGTNDLRMHDPIAPIDGTVLRVAVSPGETVRARDMLVVLEAMKMEVEVRATHDATVASVHCSPGDRVAAGMLLIQLSEETATL